MNEEMTQQLLTTAEKLANAAEALDRVLETPAMLLFVICRLRQLQTIMNETAQWQ